MVRRGAKKQPSRKPETPEPGRLTAAAAAQPRVVLVDDVPEVRDLVREYLEEEGIQVVAEASTGEEGIRLVADTSPDVVVMDARLPDIDGVEATRRIKDASPQARILMLSFYDEPELREEAARAGVFEFVTKAGTLSRLPQAILEACGSKPGSDAVGPSAASRPAG